ncbi:hypothetical protein LTR56_021049 [Elasticomyces elasticus]|nr:hypothetical protein LTR56_021049 [Elasticomyces elasticus]KAK3635262.1 hypothetical protein LTR22_019258 [Elasticomyces elasticus]KAK4911632.1 hypothetical protein LTR49_019796 [Elasticomyces elasticus]
MSANNATMYPQAALPGLTYHMKQEPEDFESTPALLEDDGLDYLEEVRREAPEQRAERTTMIYNHFGDEIELEPRANVYGHVHPPQTTLQTMPMIPMTMTMRPRPRVNNPLIEVNAGTLLPLDRPKYSVVGWQNSGIPIMRSFQAGGAPYPTVCFEEQLLYEPQKHHLICGHIATTQYVQACGGNCASSAFASGRALGDEISCGTEGCKYYSSPAAAQPASGLGHLPESFRTGPPATDPHSRKLNRHGEEDPTTCFFELRATPKSHMLVCGHVYTTLKPRPCFTNCKPHWNGKAAELYTTAWCSQPECKAESKGRKAALRKTNNQRVQKIVRPAKKVYTGPVQRMLGSLAIEGTPMLGFEQATQEPRFARPEPIEYVNSMAHVGNQNLDPVNERPHSYGIGGQRNGGFDTMPDHVHAEMVEDEGGVLIATEANRANHRTRHVDGRFDREDRAEQVEDEPAPDTDLIAPDVFCSCKSLADSYMVACARCERHFHPCCIGKGKASMWEYENERDKALQADADHWRDENHAFSCSDCDKVIAERGAARMTGADALRMVKEQVAADAKAGAAERETYQTNAAIELRLAKVAARKDPELIKAAEDRHWTQTRDPLDLDEELFGEDVNAALKARGRAGGSTRSKAKDPTEGLRAVRGSGSRVGKKSRTTRTMGPAVATALERSVKKCCVTDDVAIDMHRVRNLVEKSGLSCMMCCKPIRGLYFHCLQCKLWNCCDGCSTESHSHKRHTFEALHPRAAQTAEEGATAEDAATVEEGRPLKRSTATSTSRRRLQKPTTPAKKASAVVDVEMSGMDEHDAMEE